MHCVAELAQLPNLLTSNNKINVCAASACVYDWSSAWTGREAATVALLPTALLSRSATLSPSLSLGCAAPVWANELASYCWQRCLDLSHSFCFSAAAASVFFSCCNCDADVARAAWQTKKTTSAAAAAAALTHVSLCRIAPNPIRMSSFFLPLLFLAFCLRRSCLCCCCLCCFFLFFCCVCGHGASGEKLFTCSSRRER